MKGVRVVWMRASGVCASPPYPTVPARSVLSYLLLLTDAGLITRHNP